MIKLVKMAVKRVFETLFLMKEFPQGMHSRTPTSNVAQKCSN